MNAEKSSTFAFTASDSQYNMDREGKSILKGLEALPREHPGRKIKKKHSWPVLQQFSI